MRLIIALIATAGFAGPAFAVDTWAVREGADGKTFGTWMVEQSGTSLTGTAVMQAGDGKQLRFNVVGKVDGTHYTLNRVRPSDGTDCRYTGSLEKNDIRARTFELKGTVTCRGKGGIWTARQLPGKSKR